MQVSDTGALLPDPYDPNCPSREVLDRIGDRWTVLVVGSLSQGPLRFSELGRRVRGISQKMLTQTLRKLERDGLVTRHVYPEVPPRTEYELTKLGHTLIEPMGALCEWAGMHLSELEQARKRYDHLQKKAALSA